MSEGRRSQVVLLDERRLDLLIQPKLFAGELLDLVASHFHLKEKEYFGIAYLNEAGQFSWLQLDKRVLEHEFPRKCSSNSSPQLTFYFRVKYFVESINQLRDSATVEAFYLQAKSLLAKGELEADNDTVFQLAALVLQGTYGDYIDDESVFRSQLRRLPILPTATLKESFSITSCEEKVLNHYKALAGQSRGDAIVSYLTIVEGLPTYGQHYYEVKDKSGSQCRLGLNYKGISQYEKNDRRTPTKVFLWKQLENLYFRDKKFTIEVHEVRRVVHTLSSFNLYEDAIEEPLEEYDDLSDAICDPTTQVSVSRRTLAPANVTVYVWYASSPVVTKCIWSMAIAQHHFFLDRKHKKSLAPCLSQIATELCRSVQSLSSAGSQSNISRSTSSSSLPSTILGGELSEESKAATIEMLTALQSRREALEEALKKKNEELRALCLKEGELTGEIPPEIPLQPGEERPQVRRRVGTSFCLSDKWLTKSRSKEKEALNELELEYEIQSKIASAAYQLANDCTARKSVRKQRKMSYAQAAAKLRSLELKLRALQKEHKRVDNESRKENDGSESSISSSDKASRINLTVDSISSHSESGTIRSSVHSISSIPPCGSLPQLTVTAPSEGSSGCRQRHQSLQHVPFSENGALWTAPSSYCSSMEFDTISCGNDSVKTLPLKTPYKNRFESRLDIEGSNLYSVPNRRASQVFDSQDDFLVSGRKSDYDKRSPLKNIPIDPQSHYANTLPLSSSYDERLWCSKSKEPSSDGSSLETSFDTHSSVGYFDPACLRQTPIELSQNPVKLHHFHSEHSLLTENLEDEEQDVRAMKMTHVRSVPHLHEKTCSTQDHLLQNNASASHSLNQVAELVNASMLRQGGKRSTLSLHSQGCLSPKSKTKEWIETSLDSPPIVRRSKSKTPSENRKNVQENIYENHPIALSPYKKDNFFSSTSEDYVNVRKPSVRSSALHYTNEWKSIPVPTATPLHFAPIEKTTLDDDAQSDSVSCFLSQDEAVYEEYQNENHNSLNGQMHPFIMSVQSYPHTSDVQQVPQFQDFSYLSPEIRPHDERTQDDLQSPVRASNCQAGPQVASPQCNVSVCSSNGTVLNDTVQFNETTVVNLSQDEIEPLSPCNGGNFSFTNNVEVNVVSVGHFQPYWEETKPYELSDFYKYSTKHRKSQADAPIDDIDQSCLPHDLGDQTDVKTVFSNRCDSFLQKQHIPSPHHDIVMNAHIAVVGHADYRRLSYSSLFEGNNPTSPVAEVNTSFGEAGIKVSVADTFHDEMLAWYENRDSIKKVTLV